MEISHRPGNLTCLEVCELLSDVLDARRGEIPHPDGTRLSVPGLRPAVELHLAGCAACREELFVLEEIGAAYADFSVGEAPAQIFSDYPGKVRARMARDRHSEIPADSLRRRNLFWTRATLSAGLAAACVTLVVMRGMHTPPWRSQRQPAATTTATIAPELPSADLIFQPLHREELRQSAPLRFSNPRFSNGTQLVFEDFMYNPADAQTLEKARKEEWNSGYLIFGEKTEPGERPLLGAFLKTTRDVDQGSYDVDPGGLMVYDVIPNSPAFYMGLQKNDHIIDINGMAVKSGSADDAAIFFTAIHQLGRGAPITIIVVNRSRGLWKMEKPKRGVLGQAKPSDSRETYLAPLSL